jgi:hypothetical protein
MANAHRAISTTDLPAVYRQPTYTIRRKVLKLFGGAFYLYDAQENIVGYSQMKAFKLKEDIRLYTGEDMQTELLTIQARQILDFSAAYDVIDATTRTKVGALKRRGWKSVVQDEWIVMNPQDHDIGTIQEDSMLLAAVRRLMTTLVPQTYHGEVSGISVCTFKQHFNPFVLKMTLDFASDRSALLDRRLGLAAAILLCAIEGRQR